MHAGGPPTSRPRISFVLQKSKLILSQEKDWLANPARNAYIPSFKVASHRRSGRCYDRFGGQEAFWKSN